MNIFELFIIAVGLSMDAFAVSASKGISMRKVTLKNASVIGLYFGLFQAGMPLLGYFLGVNFKNQIESIDHWIAFILLGLIGLKMIKDSRTQEPEKEEKNQSQNMLILALATSIDALTVGITFAFLGVNIVLSVIFIGIVTFLVSILGVKIGNLFGNKFKSKAEFVGGLILILMGTKILLDHLGIINF